MGNVLPKDPVRTDITMVKIKQGRTNGKGIRKMFEEQRNLKELTVSDGVEKLSPVNIL